MYVGRPEEGESAQTWLVSVLTLQLRPAPLPNSPPHEAASSHTVLCVLCPCLQRVHLGSVDLDCTGSLTLEQLRRLLQQLCPAQSALSGAGVKQQGDWVLAAASRIWLAHGKRGR